MVVEMSLYGMKSSGSVFRTKLHSLLHNIGYTPSKEYLDVWMILAIKSDRKEYYEYALVYVDNVLVIICFPIKKTEGI